MPDIFNTSVSGLLAHQRALSTTSHNISNVNTEGYTRQRVEFGTRSAEPYGNGFIGNGVEAKTVRRQFDQVRETSVQRNTAEFARLETLADYSGRLDNLLADESAGLSPALLGFFGAVQDVANDPTSASARQALLSAGEDLSGRFQFLDGRFQAIGRDVETQLGGEIEQINQLAAGVAELNEAIVAERARAAGQPPNDLLDQRDGLVRELSDKVSTRLVSQEDGSVNVFIGSGQSLVSGFTANELKLVRGVDDPQQPDIALAGRSGEPVNVTSTLQGGRLGGLLDFRREVLGPARDNFGRIATGIAETFNAQHRKGLQFDNGPQGELGGNFFNLGEPEVINSGTNAGTTESGFASIQPDQVGGLTGDNYGASYDGSDWSLRNLTTGEQRTLTDGDTVDGVTYDLSQVSGLAGGDSFLVRPTRSAARDLSMALTRPGQVAAASPVTAQEATDANGQATNSGTGAISGLEVNNTNNLPPSSDITLTYSAAAGGFNVNGGPGGTIAYDPANDSAGKTVTAVDGLEFELSGVPQDGDSFVIGRNSDARGDNSNALALGQLTEQSVLNDGDATFQEAYGGLVGEVGTATARAKVSRDAQESVLNQAVAARDEVSGVNLEEEAADLLKFQRAFQASAQAISVANGLFDSLLSAVRG